MVSYISAVKAVAKENGYAYIFDIHPQEGVNNLIVWEGGNDVTAAVKIKLSIK